MKPINLICTITVIISNLLAVVKPAQTQGADEKTFSFQCQNIDGVPTTVANTSRGTVAIINWVSDYFSYSGYDPQTRCELVSSRFQRYYDDEQLGYLTTGRMNRQPIVCVASQEGGECQGLLFTLKPTSNPSEALQTLLELGGASSAGPLNETSYRPYIDMEQFLSTLTIIEQNPTFQCQNINDISTTVVQTSRGHIAIIRWVSEYFEDSRYDSEALCQEISQRFQAYYRAGQLDYLTTEQRNGLDVVCASTSSNSECQYLLFALKPGKTLEQVLVNPEKLPLYKSENRVYLDIRNLLDNAPILEQIWQQLF